MIYGIIYKVTNILDGKVYVGQTTSRLSVRRAQHLCEARRGTGTYFYNAIRCHGESNFIWEVLVESHSAEDLNAQEIKFIKEFDSTNPSKGYNGKEGGSRGKNTKATRQKIGKSVSNSKRFREAMKNPKLRSERSKRASQRIWPESTKKSMSKTRLEKIASGDIKVRKGFRNTKEHNKAISEGLSGRKHPKTFSFWLDINGKSEVWDQGIPALKAFLLQEYSVDVSTTGLSRLLKGVYKESKAAKVAGVELNLREIENEEN
jgi:group I intron endonuclease